MIVKYINGVKYIQIFDSEKGAKYPGIVLKYDEYNETWSDFLLMEKGEHFFNNVSIWSNLLINFGEEDCLLKSNVL